MGFLKQVQKRYADFFNAVDSRAKIVTFLFGTVVIFSVFLAGTLYRKPSYGLLYAGLSEVTASEIVNILEDNDVNYRLKNAGRNIYVLRPELNRVRLLVKEKGLPRAGESVGFEIFDKSNSRVTECVRNMQPRRVLEGELERTILKIQNVEGVRAYVVMPDRNRYEKNQEEPAATVLLTLRFEGALDPSQVGGIRQLVGAAVEGLKPGNVTIVDNYGNVLAARTDDDPVLGLLNNRIDVQKSVEAYYTRKVQTLLDSVLGRNHSAVRLDALLNFDKIEETEEKYDPDSAVVRSESIASETTSGETNAARGSPGIQADTLPAAPANNARRIRENQSNREVINNKYEIDKKIRHIVKSVGDIRKLTVSVFLRQKVATDEEGNPKKNENGELVFEKRTPEDIKMFTEMVKNAIGFDEERGDKVAVKEIPFDRPDPGREIMESGPPLVDANPMIGPVLNIFALLAGIVFLAMVLKRIFFNVGTDVPGPGRDERRRSAAPISCAGEKEEELSELLQSMEMMEKGVSVEHEIRKLVDRFPVESESVFKQWLEEK